MVMVLGYALDTQYELTVELVEASRELRPAAALALGQVGHSIVKKVPLNAQHVARVAYTGPSTAKDAVCVRIANHLFRVAAVATSGGVWGQQYLGRCMQ